MGKVVAAASFAIALTVLASARADDVPALPPHAVKAPALPSELLVETHGWLRVAYHPSGFDGVRRVLEEADGLRASLANTLGQNVLERVEIRIARTHEEMASLAPIESPPPKAARGVAYPPLGLVVLSQRTDAGANVDLVESMRHQLAHVALFDAAAGRALPRWLQEGFAFEVSGEAALRRVQALASAKARGKLATIDRLEVFPVSEPDLRVAVAESADFVHYLSHGEQRAPFAATIARVRNGEPLPVAIDAAYGRDLRALETAWRDDLAHRYVTVPLVATGAAGWSLAIGVWALRRRKKKRAETETLDAELMPPELPEPAAPRSSSRLLVCDRGVGHVVYIVAGKGVPKVEHDGKRHTLH